MGVINLTFDLLWVSRLGEYTQCVELGVGLTRSDHSSPRLHVNPYICCSYVIPTSCVSPKNMPLYMMACVYTFPGLRVMLGLTLPS